MALFTNYATLSYSGGTVTSNTVTGEILETTTASKTAVTDEYLANTDVTYVISILNNGTSDVTGLAVTDDLGGYAIGDDTVYPLAYVDGSVRYYVNGVLQPAPAVTAGPPMVVAGINVPAGGNALLIYEAMVTPFAPLASGSVITNTATISGAGRAVPVSVSETITAADNASLQIRKAVSPAVVEPNGELTYLFTIENTGNTPATVADSVVLSDTFDPILESVDVTYNGASWTEGVNYTYSEATGEFATLPGQITVPAATYTQNPDGTWTVAPGTVTVEVTGTIA